MQGEFVKTGITRSNGIVLKGLNRFMIYNVLYFFMVTNVQDFIRPEA